MSHSLDLIGCYSYPCKDFTNFRCLGRLLFNHLRYFADASKTGVAQETLQNAVRRSSKVMTEQEARQILNVSETTTWEEVLKVNISNIFIFGYPLWPHIFVVNGVSKTCFLNPSRDTTLYLKTMRRTGPSTFSQKFTGPRNV